MASVANINDKDTCDMSESEEAGPSKTNLFGGKYCCVVGCTNNQKRDLPKGISFYSFPRDCQRRQMWERAVNREVPGKKTAWKSKSHHVVCSSHFVGGKKSMDKNNKAYIPTIFPTNHIKPGFDEGSSRAKRRQRLEQARAQAEEGGRAEEDPANTGPDDGDRSFDQPDKVQIEGMDEMDGVDNIDDGQFHQDHTYARPDWEEAPVKDFSMQVFLPESQSTSFEWIVDYASPTEKGTQVCSNSQDIKPSMSTGTQTSRTTALSFLTYKDNQFKALCGVTKNFVKFLTHRVADSLSCGRILSVENKILLLLTKFKLNVSFAVLAAFFDISESLARDTFFEALDAVFEVVSQDIIWFDKPTIQSRMPTSFKALFPQARAIIDCSEIQCERPSTIDERVQHYSHYKSHFTLKFLIAVAPSGEIMFVSKMYGGRSSDTEITVSSGFLNLIESGDVILSDKGFPSIELDINQAGGILVMPPFKVGNRQFSEKQNRDGYQCASVRVHVERAIERLKRFEIMTFTSSSMRPHMDKVLMIVSFIANCFPDLIRD